MLRVRINAYEPFYVARIEFKKSINTVLLRKMSEEWQTPPEEESLEEEDEEEPYLYAFDSLELDEEEEVEELVEEEEEISEPLETSEYIEDKSLIVEDVSSHLDVPGIPSISGEEEITKDEEIMEDVRKEEVQKEIDEVTAEKPSIKLVKDKKKFKDLSPKKKTTVMGLIFLLASLIASMVFSVAYHFTPLINKAKGGVLDVLPGNFIAEIAILWTAIFATFFVFLALLPYFSKFYIFIHKLVKLFRFRYSVVKTDEHYYNFKEIIKRVLPVFSISFLLGYWFGKWFFVSSIGDPGDEAINTMVYILVSFIFMPLSTLLVPPLWLLNDSGIIAMKKRKDGERKIPEIEGPSRYFNDLFTGSVTTLAITTLVIFIIDLEKDFQWDIVVGFIFVMIIVFPLIIIAIIYLYEIFMRRLRRKLHRILPDKLVDKMPKTVVDISAFDPFYIPEMSKNGAMKEPIEIKDPQEFQIETDEITHD
jgi:hypothetical protein